MTHTPPNVKSIFLAAIEKSPGQRAEFVRESCGDDEELLRRVQELVEAHDNMGSPPSRIPGAIGPTLDQPITEKPGTQIGPYKLLQQLGEGGMGVVYMAEQSEPVERRVALKIIKPGMDTRQVIARFEAEEQALAMMDHPNIAKVLDAGSTESGRPYFVMELVRGIAITTYCDQQRLTPKERLQLFIPVCHAVQHAHQKGIIHRDLKPSNILVALYDGQPVPKVIDFGVAKATSRKLTEKTMFTHYGQIVGTLEYMSPEQADLNQLDIDTRSDVYSLGLLLYELLTGATPFDRERLRSAAFEEVMRIIREEEPPRPSFRLSTIDTLPSVAACRKIDPRKLGTLVRGELDWIVMKALEKERARRYETASALAADVQRFLNEEAVTACPPSHGYKLRKFVRRNKAKLVTASVLAAALLVAMGGVGWAVRDRAAVRQLAQQERAARQARVSRQVELILENVVYLEREQNWPEALAAAERAAAVIEGGRPDDGTKARVQHVLAELTFVQRLDAARQWESYIVDRQFDRVGAEQAYAQAFSDFGLTIEGVTVEHAAEQLRSRPEIVVEAATALVDWARLQRILCKNERGDHTRWKRLLAVADALDPDNWHRKLRAAWKASDVRSQALHDLAESADPAALPAPSVALLARLLAERGSTEKAVTLLLEAWQYRPADFWINFDLANYLASSSPKRFDDAIDYLRAALALRPGNPAVLNNLANLLNKQKKHDEAIACFGAALARHSDLPRLHYNLAIALLDQKKLVEAIAEFRTAIRLAPQFAPLHRNLGFALQQQGDLDAALTEYRTAISLDARYADPHNLLGTALETQENIEAAMAEYRLAIQLDANHAKAHNNLGHLLFDQGRIDEAIAAFRAAIAADPDYAEAYSNLGAALLQCGELDEALAHLRRSIEMSPNHTSAHNNLGHALQDLGQLDEAIAEYRLAIQLDQTMAEPHLNLGTALAKRGQPQEAIAHYLKAIELNPHDPAAYFNLANALKALGKFDKAIVAYRQAVELDSTKAAVHYNLGNVLQVQEHLDEAMVEFRAAIQLDATLAEAHNNLGNVLRRLGHLDEAIEEYRAALAINPQLMPAQNNLGRTLHEQKKLPEASAAYLRAIEIVPENAAAYNSLGVIRFEQGDQEGAIAALRRAFEIGLRAHGPQHPLTQMARTNLASLATNWSWTLSTAADESTRDPNKAVALARLATDLQPNNATHWDNLGVAHYRRGDFQSAIDALNQADTLLNESNGANRMFLAMAHWRLERCETARKFYAQGAAWIAVQAEQDEEQRRFRDEAEALMGIDAHQRDVLVKKDISSTEEDSQNNK